jgi:hypothetical protein
MTYPQKQKLTRKNSFNKEYDWQDFRDEDWERIEIS